MSAINGELQTVSSTHRCRFSKKLKMNEQRFLVGVVMTHDKYVMALRSLTS